MRSGGKIDAYLDCNSPYSYFALVWLRRNKQLLADNGVEVNFHPIFLGGINVGSGNKPPWTLPAKAEYGKYDRPRAEKYFQTMEMKAPPFFPIMSLLPMRCMLYIKDNYLKDRYEHQFGELWTSYWKDQMDISKPDVMGECLGRHFSQDDVERILVGGTSPKYKKSLTDETAKMVEKGAFGAPWFIVRNKEGKEEPFFGSDRFAHMLQYLGVEFQDITILPKDKSRL